MPPPHKKFNYISPYGQNVSQYPSQNSEYVTQQYGGFYEDRQNTAHIRLITNNRPHFYQDRSQQNNDRHYRQRQKYSDHPHRSDEKDAFSQYFHESMLEDPWKHLIAREQAINGSKVHNRKKDGDDGIQFHHEN